MPHADMHGVRQALAACPQMQVTGGSEGCGVALARRMVLSATLWGQRPCQRLTHGLFDAGQKGPIAFLNSLPNPPKLYGRPENLARLPSVHGMPDTLDAERTYQVIHMASSRGLVRWEIERNAATDTDAWS
jgi:hypothetical protein